MPLRHSNCVDVLVGLRLRQRRKQLGLTQEMLGEALGITQQQVQKYERGVNRLSAVRLHALTHILHVPCSYFFKIGEEKPAENLEADAAGWLADQQCQALNSAYVGLQNPKLRDAVMAVIKTIGEPTKLIS